MQVRGEKKIDAKTIIESKLKVEFYIKQGMEKFKIRNTLLNILNRLHLADPEMYVKDGDKTWRDDKEFPSGKTFKEIFSKNQADPPRGKPMM
eukprot:11311374-Ditylum_brightwellii.AAC.1